MQALSLCLSPGPHDAEQEDQGDHNDQPPSTGGHTLARLIVHSEVWWFGPSQGRPPFWGEGAVQVRLRVLLPGPQVVEQ